MPALTEGLGELIFICTMGNGSVSFLGLSWGLNGYVFVNCIVSNTIYKYNNQKIFVLIL